jgi:DNA-directed RNA polymerase subunit M/transcription elongation factor TFIIS
MEDSNSLRRILRDLSISLAQDNEFRDISFRYDDELGAYTEDGEVTVNTNQAEILDADISEKEEFGLLVGTESHELEHAVSTDPEGIKDFSEEYENKRPRLAAFVWNIVEDVYIDKKRLDRDPGLRPIQNKFIDILRQNKEDITESEPPEKHADAILHIGKLGGTPVGFENVEDEEFRDFCAEARYLLEEARTTYIQSERTEIAHEIMDLIEEHAGSLEVPDMDLPPFMTAMPEDMNGGNGDPLPEPAENEEDEEPETPAEMQSGGSSGSSGGSSGNSSGNGGSTKSTPDCPSCGFSDTSMGKEIVDGMTAARCGAPFNPEADWIANVNFVEDNLEDGLCGFRVTIDGDVPRAQIQSHGFMIEQVSNKEIEIVEPKERYDDKEPVIIYDCPDCGHNWLPGLGEK